MKKFISITLASFIALSTFASPAAAKDPLVVQAMNDNIIGEQANGYLGFVKPATASQKTLEKKVSEINAGRRAVYTEDAAKPPVSTVDIVGIATAFILIKKAPNGAYFKDMKGKWCEKSDNSRIEQAADNTIIIACAAN